jgi:coproporphyrinogen III oxidase-like Fe-S oxidoreductase
VKQPARYLATAGTAAEVHEQRAVTASELPFEYAMNALRLNEGFRYDDFAQRTGLPASQLEPTLERAARLDLVERDAGGVRPPARGRTYLNRLTQLFLP